MGVCCNFNNTEKPTSETQFSPEDDNNPINNVYIVQNNINSTYEENHKFQNIKGLNKQIKNWSEQKDTLMNKNNISIDKPDNIDEIFLDNNKLENSYNISVMEENDFGINLLKMEKNIFDLINELRTNPKSFIEKIEKYKNIITKKDNKQLIIIDDNEFEFETGEKCFNECIEFLNNQKSLQKFEKNQSMFECKKFFMDKNIADLLFVVVYNLIDINSPEDNKIRRNCLMSKEYNKLNITITKDEIGNKLYSYYFSFDI